MNVKRTRVVKARRPSKKREKNVQRPVKLTGRMLVLAAAALVVFVGMVIGGNAYEAKPASQPLAVNEPAVDFPASSTSRIATRPLKPEPRRAPDPIAMPDLVAPAERSTPPADPATPDSTNVGCLRTDDGGNGFVLTDLDGKNAPKSRNWKTLFITKKSARLPVVSAGTLNLRPHVGQMVQLTGTRTETTFTARSLKVVRSTCG